MNMTAVPLEPLMLDLPGYGYVLVTVVLVWFLLFWQGFMVGRMRTKYKVTGDQQIFLIVYQIFSTYRWTTPPCTATPSPCLTATRSVITFGLIYL